MITKKTLTFLSLDSNLSRDKKASTVLVRLVASHAPPPTLSQGISARATRNTSQWSRGIRM
ncbi:hypothetical protein ACSS6W_005679 [Trichoderma asperelloides]